MRALRPRFNAIGRRTHYWIATTKARNAAFLAKPHASCARLKAEDRFSHIYIIGKTGTGTSTLIDTMALQDLERGNGFALIDPHGDLVARIAAQIPASQRHRVIYLNATDRTQPYGYNPLRHVREDRIALAASGMMDVFKKMWPDAWGVRMEHILRDVLMALLEQPDATLHDVLRIFSDNEFRKTIAKSLRNNTVRTFLLKEFERFSFGYRADGTAPIQNKVGAFLADPLLNRILTAPEKDLHIRGIMDQGQVLLVNLAKGHIGEDSSSLLGPLLVTTIGLAAFSRADTPPAERRDFFVYIDEFQSFTTLALANMLSELRLVYVSLCAFSHAGPWASRRGFDTVVQTVSGMTIRQAECIPGKSPAPASELERWSTVSETPSGRLRHLKPAVQLSETPPYWARPSVPLGYHRPVWP